MEKNYFIVLQLPFVVEPRFTAKDSNKFFWTEFANEVAQGKLKIISRRNDTGVSEEFREYAKKAKTFSSYILLDMKLTDSDVSCENSIFKKAAIRLRKGKHQIMIDSAEKFNLLAFES